MIKGVQKLGFDNFVIFEKGNKITDWKFLNVPVYIIFGLGLLLYFMDKK